VDHRVDRVADLTAIALQKEGLGRTAGEEGTHGKGCRFDPISGDRAALATPFQFTPNHRGAKVTRCLEEERAIERGVQLVVPIAQASPNEQLAAKEAEVSATGASPEPVERRSDVNSVLHRGDRTSASATDSWIDLERVEISNDQPTVRPPSPVELEEHVLLMELTQQAFLKEEKGADARERSDDPSFDGVEQARRRESIEQASSREEPKPGLSTAERGAHRTHDLPIVSLTNAKGLALAQEGHALTLQGRRRDGAHTAIDPHGTAQLAAMDEPREPEQLDVE